MFEVNKRIHVVINPASGQDQYILNTINRVFRESEIAWDVSVTQKSGDARRFARQAVAEGADIVAAYGGDGTVMEVADGVAGGEIPMAILPGGTANLMSVELGIPKDLAKAAQIITDPNSVIRQVDVGQVGEKQFILRVGIGFAAEKVKIADREMKDKWGILAYSIAGLKALKTTPMAQYHITVDGVEHETDGKTCLIDNAGNMGLQGVSAAKTISVSDGLLDVIVVRNASISSWIAVGDQVLGREPKSGAVKHWQGREISIECDPPQTVQVDGEVWDPTPFSVKVLPGVLPILTPPLEGKMLSQENDERG
ncbi:MAG: diacylglycerol kinase family lipid kinase [Anaerolineales bacterium]|jgi:YegS/Rv2252/BmrU family lipid kinase